MGVPARTASRAPSSAAFRIPGNTGAPKLGAAVFASKAYATRPRVPRAHRADSQPAGLSVVSETMLPHPMRRPLASIARISLS